MANSVSIPLESGHIVIKDDNYKKTRNRVSIPLESGHIVIYLKMGIQMEVKRFNPLRIGSYCNCCRAYNEPPLGTKVSIPLESGHIVIVEDYMVRNQEMGLVSIPLESGHIVMKCILSFLTRKMRFNPLRIGSYCNQFIGLTVKDAEYVSIPLESGHIVI